MSEELTLTSFETFLSRKPYSVVHVDASWDGYRKQIEDQIKRIETDSTDVSFGYADCDKERDLARRMRILNLPSVAYYKGIDLIAVVVGIKQNISENIKLVKDNKVLDTSNILSRG